MHADNKAKHEEIVGSEGDDESHMEVNGDHSPADVATIEIEDVSDDVQIEEMIEPVLETADKWSESFESPASKKKKKHRIASQFELS